MQKMLRILYFAAGLAAIGYYFLLGKASRFGLSISWFWLALGAVLVAAGAATFLTVPKWLRWGWRGLLCLGLVAMLALECLVISGMHAEAPADLDYIIILGARVDPEGPSPALTRRLNAVMAVLDEHPRAVLIASGGQGADEPISEARCIHDELVRRGVEPSRIRIEDQSTDTIQNIDRSMALIDDPAASVGIITNNYHVWRAVRLARRAGLVNAHGIAADYTGHTLFHYMVREAFSIVVATLRGRL